MSRRPKFLFDENFGRPAVALIAQVVGANNPDDDSSPLVKHIFDLHDPGTKDSDWIPKLADEEWIVITGDRGRSGGDKLPDLCVQHKVTHVLLGAKVHHRTSQQKVMTIVSVWGLLLKLPDATPGSRYSLVAVSSKPEDATRATLKLVFEGPPPQK